MGKLNLQERNLAGGFTFSEILGIIFVRILGGIVAINNANKFSIKTLFVYFTAILGCFSLVFIYQTWGSIGLSNSIIFTLSISLLTLLEFQLFKNHPYISFVFAWILGLGLFYGPTAFLPIFIGRTTLLLRRKQDINPVFQWGREVITCFISFLFLYSMNHPNEVMDNIFNLKFAGILIPFASIVPFSEVFGFVIWEMASKKTRINLPIIVILSLVSLLWVFIAPLQVYLYKHFGAFMLSLSILAAYLLGAALSKLMEFLRRFYKYQYLLEIMKRISSVQELGDSLKETISFVQMKLPTDNISLFSIEEGSDTWDFTYASGKKSDWEQKNKNLDKMQWKQLFLEDRMGLYLKKQFEYGEDLIVIWLVFSNKLAGALILTGAEYNMDNLLIENLRTDLGALLVMLMRQFVLQNDNEFMNKEIQDLREHLKQTKAQLVHSSKISTLGQMAAGVSHEINNPIGAILTNAQFLEMIIQGETEKESLENIITAARRCKDITRKLLNYSHTETIEYTEIDLNEVVKNTISMLQYSFTIDRVQLNKELSDLPLISGNFNELSQVLTNILINAKDAILGRKLSMKEGFVQVRTRSSDGYVFMEVEDNGIGMSEHVVGKVFHPFFTTKDIGKGTGMGLSICKGIIDKHNGEIIVSSKEGKGTLITVKLPAIAKKGEDNGSEDFNN